LWLVTDSEARHLIDREPFAKALKGLPEPDRMAVVRLAVEAYRRERLTRVGTKRPLSKCIDNAARCYRQWRDERPDDYQLWRDLLYTPRMTTTGSVDVSNNNPSRLENDPMVATAKETCSYAPRNCWGTISVDAMGTVVWHDIATSLEGVQDRFHRFDVPDDAVEPVRWGYIPIDDNAQGVREKIQWVEPAAV
jgi:hypothetical protein